VAECLSAGLQQSPLMDWQDSRDNAATLDAWRRAIGLEYHLERPDSHRGPLLAPVAVTQPASAGRIAHLDKPVSRLVMGCDNQPSMSHAAVMWDDYIEQGGNCFDTAYIYGGGSMERLLGHWHRQRNLREQIVIIGKGAHTPDNAPEFIAPQLDESLQRLQTDYVDLYFLHRDNLDIPVKEFVDALNAERNRGRIRAFGGSNWTLPRIRAANEYAAAEGLQGFTAVSNNFSLARMVTPIWPGVEAATSGEFRAYLRSNGIALLPWSSQARGFFTPWAESVINAAGAREGRALTSVEPTEDELRRVWFSEANFERRRRAASLARENGVDLIQIALAYVAQQPFACFPLIGPRQLSETQSCFAALQIELSPAQLNWLDLSDRGTSD
ncbi:MAG: aldo/keto reductase, partial [Pseudomonadales bacterium]|nr:aldo/keto reductase [Pseudomonadales bacterium]